MTAPERFAKKVSFLLQRDSKSQGQSGQRALALPRLSLRFGIALRRCEACTSKKECREWLDQAPPRAILAPRFCKNADILFELQCEEPGPRATG